MRALVAWALRSRDARPLRAAALLVVAYLALERLFAHLVRTEGLLSPSGAPHMGALAVGAVYLLTRIVVRLGVPAIVAYVAVKSVAARGP